MEVETDGRVFKAPECCVRFAARLLSAGKCAGCSMNGPDRRFPGNAACPTVNRRTSTRVGSRVMCHDAELEVTAIGPFAREGGSGCVVFLARSVGGAPVDTGTILDTLWGVCEVVG